ncbi:MAG: hypothetical protein U0587_01425 [Candidatus Binatia bacterium]
MRKTILRARPRLASMATARTAAAPQCGFDTATIEAAVGLTGQRDGHEASIKVSMLRSAR